MFSREEELLLELPVLPLLLLAFEFELLLFELLLLPESLPLDEVLRQTASLLSYMRVAITCPYAILIGIWADSSLNILICG